MPHYRPDPLDPTKNISAIDLLRRNPTETPPPCPRILAELLKADTWTRRAALLILAGYSPSNITASVVGSPAVIAPEYLDGTTWGKLSEAGLSHPRQGEAFEEYLRLTGYAAGGDPDERKTPSEWLAWAKSKGFTPYWERETQSATDTPDAGSSWQDKARTIADEIDGEDAATTGDPWSSLTDMADRVAEKMRERGIHGPHGPLSGSTIKREALQGGRWHRERKKPLRR